MPLTYMDVGIGNAASYQVSGYPHVTGSWVNAGTEVLIEFPFVPKAFTLFNTGANDLRVHFVSKDNTLVYGNSHFITVVSTANYRFQAKCRHIYVSNNTAGQSGFQLFSELTGIDAKRASVLSGSGINT